jgi:hypothetical protein
MPKMNYWPDKWDLRVDLCPCDTQFNEWVASQKLTGKTFYHFGTGQHHVIGLEQWRAGNRVFAITASKEEYDAYINLVTENVRLAKSYLVYFGDIYLSDAALLPQFDAVTLFHLAEFLYDNTPTADYGGLDDRGLCELMTERTRPGGHILLYRKSVNYDRAEPAINAWAKAAPVEPLPDYKWLQVFRKLG